QIVVQFLYFVRLACRQVGRFVRIRCQVEQFELFSLVLLDQFPVPLADYAVRYNVLLPVMGEVPVQGFPCRRITAVEERSQAEAVYFNGVAGGNARDLAKRREPVMADNRYVAPA